MKKLGVVLLAALGMQLASTFASAQSVLDPSLPAYRPGDKLSGQVTLIGSHTMSQVASMWADGFRQFHPDVTFDIRPEGSVETVPAVIGAEATFGLLSRTIREEEAAAFEAKFGYPPTIVTPTLESMAIFVHKDNPIEGLTLQQLDAILSTTRHRGAAKAAATWGDLGLTGRWASMPIVVNARRDTTGSQVFIQAAVLQGGKFRTDMQQHLGNLDLVKAVASDPGAIGFAGLTYHIPGIKPVPLAVETGRPYVGIDSVAAAQGEYPLVRPLQLVVNRPPQKNLSRLQAEFLKYVFSQLGQEDVVKAGFQSIAARPAHSALQAVGLGVAQ